MFISEFNFLETTLFLVVILILLYWLSVTMVTDKSRWNRFMSAYLGSDYSKRLITLTLTVLTLMFASLSTILSLMSVLIISLNLLDFTILLDLCEAAWDSLRSVGSQGALNKRLEEIPLAVRKFLFQSKRLTATTLIILVFVLSLHLLNFSLVRGWNFCTSVIPGLSYVEVLVGPVLNVIVFVFGSLSSTLFFSGVLIILLHLLNITIVTEFFKCAWTWLKSVDPREKRVKMLGALALTITALLLSGFVSSAFLVIGVLLRLLKFTTGTVSFESSWNRVLSVINVYIFKKVDDGKRLVKTVKEKSTLLTKEAGSLPTYKIPLKEKTTSTKGCKYFSFGKKSTKPNRTIVVLGATGAGKTAVISGMINHILGVTWEGSHRFQMVHEGQAMSQDPSEVTVYKIYHQEDFEIDHSLTIVDIPDFEDTNDGAPDLKVNEQLLKLFYSLHDVSEVDAVCFVAPASLTRLSPAQESVFDSIFNVFGKDAAKNIRILVTFADDQQPAVLEAIKASGIPCSKGEDGLPVHFKFNESVLFVDKDTAGRNNESDQSLWNMMTSSLKSFFSALIHETAIKLTLTSEALGGRQQVESLVEDLQTQVKVSLGTIEKLRETMEKVKENEAEVTKNEDFEFYVTIKRPVQVDISDTGNYITNCQQCHVTCHYPCKIPNDDGKIKCFAMGPDGYCKVCPGKCFWNVHFNQTFRWEYQEFQEKQTVRILRENIDEDTEEKVTGKWLIEGLKAEHDEVQKQMIKAIKISAQCLNRLNEMMNNPNPLSILEYIDMLIEGEKKEAKPGWNQRVDCLMKVKENI